MAELQYKQRVKLSEEWFLADPRPDQQQRRFARAWFALAWLGFTGLSLGVATGQLPLGDWLRVALEPRQDAHASRRAPPGRPRVRPERPSPTLKPRATAPAAAALTTPGSAALDDPSRSLAHLAPPQLPAAEPESAPLAAGPDPELELVPDEVPQPDLDSEPSAPAPAGPEPTVRGPATASAGGSCEAAAARANQLIDPGQRLPKDLSREDFAQVLGRGTYFSHCAVPDNSAVDICVAVQHGRAIGVTVTTNPGTQSLSQCVARAVRGLSFPSHPAADVVRTRFAP